MNVAPQRDLRSIGEFASLGDALAAPIPRVHDVRLHTEFMTRLHDVLVAAHRAPGSLALETRLGLRRLRETLHETIVAHHPRLAALSEAHMCPGYNRLTAVIVNLAHANVLLVTRGAADPFLHANDTSAALANLDMTRWNIHTTPGGVRDIACMAMSELAAAVNAILWRLHIVPHDLNENVVRALEMRISQFILSVDADAANYDVAEWTSILSSTRRIATRRFVATATWWLVTLRRYHAAATYLVNPATYAPTEERGAVVFRLRQHDGLAAAVANVTHSLRDLIRHMDKPDYTRNFRRIAYESSVVAPGLMSLHTRVYGIGGAEPASAQSILRRERTPVATEWIEVERYKRTLPQWYAAFVRRRECEAAGAAGGGIANERFIEQLAVLHAVNSLLASSKYNIPFAEYFVVMMSSRIFDDLQKLLANSRLPCMVQRFGGFVVVVPAPPKVALERLIRDMDVVAVPASDASADESEEERCAAAVFVCRDVIEALAVWARAFLLGWDGSLERSAQSLKPFLTQLLRVAPAPTKNAEPSDIYFHK